MNQKDIEAYEKEGEKAYKLRRYSADTRARLAQSLHNPIKDQRNEAFRRGFERAREREGSEPWMGQVPDWDDDGTSLDCV